MSDFNYKKYVENNPLLKEEKTKEGIVDDYADRMVGAGLDLKGTLQLVDYYINNPEEIPEPMDKDLFVAHGDKIADATKQLYLRVYEGKEEKKEEVNEVQDRTEALDKLRDILEDLKFMSKEANELLSSYFPSAHTRAEAYGALDFGTSSNRYDTTLESIIDGLERGIDVD